MTPEEKKAADELLLKNKEIELKGLKIEKPEDLEKSFTLLKEISELKGKNVDEKLAELEKSKAELIAFKESNTATETELKRIADELATTVKALDMVQTQAFVKGKNAPALNTVKSFNDVIAEAMEAKHDDFQKMGRGEKSVKSIVLDLKAVADTSTANVTGGTVWGAQYKPGIIMNQNRKTHLRDLITVLPAGPGTDYYFMRENGVGEGAPAPTSEKKAAAATTQATGLKPQFDIDLIESSVKFETIAGFMLASRKAMMNIPSFVSFLQKRIPEKLLNVEDSQILYGTGTSPEIKGLLVSGNFTAGQAAGATPLAEKILIDLGVFEDTYERTADMITMRPVDYWSFFRNKATGSGEYDLPSNVTFVNGVLYIGGVPVSKTTALTANDYMIADSTGFDLLQQESMRLEFFYEDGTNVRTNQVTIRIEETVALPVYGSDYVLKGSSALS